MKLYSTNHNKALDSLRGIASVTVLFFHLFVLNHALNDIYKPWFFWLAGPQAVILFFVLSGFVLTLALSNSKSKPSFGGYALKRIFRIYPAYYLSMLLIILLFVIVKPVAIPGLSDWWFNAQFSQITFNLDAIVQTVTLFVGGTETAKINGVVWSLLYEFIISLTILPIIWKFGRGKAHIFFAIFFFYIILKDNNVLGVWNIYAITIPKIIYASVYFSMFFYMGYLLCIHKDKLKLFANSKYLPIYILIFTSQYLGFGKGMFSFGGYWQDFSAAIGSCGLILMCLYNSKTKQILSNKVFHFFGRISYSFYVLQMFVIELVVYTLHDYLSIWFLRIIILLVLPALAFLSYKFVEMPLMQLGKRLTTVKEAR